jgi:hypothetical protein
MALMMPMIARTSRSSIKVKPDDGRTGTLALGVASCGPFLTIKRSLLE